jgi:hypothetical protein
MERMEGASMHLKTFAVACEIRLKGVAKTPS